MVEVELVAEELVEFDDVEFVSFSSFDDVFEEFSNKGFEVLVFGGSQEVKSLDDEETA